MSDTTHRCSICDRTNNIELTTFPEQYFKGPYTLHEVRHGFDEEHCGECDDAIYDTTLIWEDDDDENED